MNARTSDAIRSELNDAESKVDSLRRELTEAHAAEVAAMPDKFTCARRAESGLDRDESPFVYSGKNLDYWREDGRCSYCGSLKPAEVFTQIEAGNLIVPTDKSYKIYVGVERKKFYFQHLSDDEQTRFIDLLNARKINIGIPGHFYVLPYFAKRGEKS